MTCWRTSQGEDSEYHQSKALAGPTHSQRQIERGRKASDRILVRSTHRLLISPSPVGEESLCPFLSFLLLFLFLFSFGGRRFSVYPNPTHAFEASDRDQGRTPLTHSRQSSQAGALRQDLVLTGPLFYGCSPQLPRFNIGTPPQHP